MEITNSKYMVHGVRETRSSWKPTPVLQGISTRHRKLRDVSRWPFSEDVVSDLHYLLQEKGTDNTSAFVVTRTDEGIEALMPDLLTPGLLADFFLADNSSLKKMDLWKVRAYEVNGGDGTAPFGPELKYEVEGCWRKTFFDAAMTTKIQQKQVHLRLIPPPSSYREKTKLWESNSISPDSRHLMSYLIQINQGISAFHLDDESMGGWIALHRNFTRTVKVVIVAVNNSSSCRETIRKMTRGLLDKNRPVSPDEHVKVWLRMVRLNLCSMHILTSNETGKLLQNGLYHGVITVFQDHQGSSIVDEVDISILYGRYEMVGACPSPRMDPDNGKVNTLKVAFYGSRGLKDSLQEAQRKSEEGSALRGKKRERFMKKHENMKRGKALK